MFFEGLDEIDKKIVQLLLENARMSYSEIGSKVNLSRVAVKSRIEALMNREIIEKFSVIINPDKISNYLSVYCDIEIEPRNFNKVLSVLQDNESITQIYQISGNTRLHVHAMLRYGDEAERFQREFLYRIPGVVKVEISILLNRIKDIKGIRL